MGRAGRASSATGIISAMWNLAPRLQGQLVTLEPIAASHRDALYAIARPREIWSWWPIDPALDEPTFARWVQTMLANAQDGRSFHFATLDAATGQPLGSTSFCTIRPGQRAVEIGWTWLTPSAWGTGANTEAKLLQLRYAFETLGCIRVDFETDENNVRSRAALQALPARLEGILRNWHPRADGPHLSSALYSILDTEWPAVAASLTARVDAAVARRARAG